MYRRIVFDMKERFEFIPKPLKNLICGRFLIGGISLIVGIVMFAVSEDYVLCLPCLVLFAYPAIDGGRIMYSADRKSVV